MRIAGQAPSWSYRHASPAGGEGQGRGRGGTGRGGGGRGEGKGGEGRGGEGQGRDREGRGGESKMIDGVYSGFMRGDTCVCANSEND